MKGGLWYVEGGKHVRIEYAPDHKWHGRVCVFEDGKHTRTEYAPEHKWHGRVCFSAKHDQIRFFDTDVRT